MKRLLISFAAVCLLCPASVRSENPMCATYAPQWGGHIGLYSDASATSPCVFDEVLFAANHIYIAHTLAYSGNTAQFCLTTNWDMEMTVDYGTNLVLGDLYTGVAVTYVGCKLLPYVLATLTYIPTVPTPQCTYIMQIVADPAVLSGNVEVVDCNSNVQLATGGMLWVKYPGCTGTACGDIDCPVGAEPTTWGRVKSLYH